MQYDEVLQATLFLSCYFNSNEVKNVSPLTPTEYARLAAWLHSKGLTPANLLHDQESVLAEWQDPKNKITPERIKTLFSRGASMGFALEYWDKHGIWVIPRASKLYPKQIRVKIGETRPPILFGVGNKALLSKSGIGFVGSRSVAAEDEAFAKTMAELAVDQGYVVVSGGAKGIDQTAMASALAYGGESVGILADSLLRASVSKIYREGLRDNKLALISPFYPEAGFSPGNAMARNKYIYAMSEAVVVVKSDLNKGGTWSGAVENIKKQWVPLLVRNSNHEGNQELVKLGGLAIDDSFADFNHMPQPKAQPQSQSESQNKPQQDPLQQTQDKKAPLAAPKADKPLLTDDLFAAPVVEKPIAEMDSEEPTKEEPQSEDLSIKADLESDQTNAVEATEPPDENAAPEITVAPAETAVMNGVEECALDNDGARSEPAPANDEFFKEYGEILAVFAREVKAVCEREKTVTSTQLLGNYPELPEVLIKKWLKLLEEQGYLAKTGRKLIYQLTDKAIKA